MFGGHDRALTLYVVWAVAVAQAAAPGASGARTKPATAPATAPSTAPATRPAAAPPGARITPDGWFAPPPKVERPPLPKKVTAAYVLPIREPITQKTYEAMKRKLLTCRSKGAELIVFDMDTWGGDAMAALDIGRMLKADFDDIRKVCYARTRAISAGALIAMACDEIVMAPVGKLGDCAPISMGELLKGVRREKIETVLRTEFEESAQLHGYNRALSVSMVSYDLEVWLVRNKKTRELRHVLAGDFRGRTEIPPGVSEVKSNAAGQWLLLRVVVPEGKLLTMNPKRAEEYGFAAAIIKSPRTDPLAGLLAHYHVAGPPKVFEDNWSERMVDFLTSAPVAGFLMFVGILCFYVEVNTPGFGVAGAAAIACFAVLVGSRYLTGLAQWWEIVLFAVGLVLIGVEIFVTPGFGVLGISGILCCIIGLLAMVVPNAPDKLPLPATEIGWSIFRAGALALSLGFIAGLVGAAVLARFLPNVPVASRLILGRRGPTEPGPGPEVQASSVGSIAVGALGVATSVCRPVGQVRLHGKLVDAVADGGFIAAGTKVKVIKNEGNRIVVTPVDT